MNVSVFGLGYVGCVSAAAFADDGHDVVGVDVIRDKVDAVNAGRSPIVEPGLDELLQRGASEGRLRATTSTEDAVRATDLSLLCVGVGLGCGPLQAELNTNGCDCARRRRRASRAALSGPRPH